MLPYQLSYAVGYWNVAMDYLLLSIPIYVIARSGIELGQKTRLISIFLVGFFTCILATFRMVVPRKSKDLIDDWPKGFSMWAVGEVTLSILIASLPVRNILLRPLTYSKIRHAVSSKLHSISDLGSRSQGSSQNKSPHSTQYDGEGVRVEKIYRVHTGRRGDLEAGTSHTDEFDESHSETSKDKESV